MTAREADASRAPLPAASSPFARAMPQQLIAFCIGRDREGLRSLDRAEVGYAEFLRVLEPSWMAR